MNVGFPAFLGSEGALALKPSGFEPKHLKHRALDDESCRAAAHCYSDEAFLSTITHNACESAVSSCVSLVFLSLVEDLSTRALCLPFSYQGLICAKTLLSQLPGAFESNIRLSREGSGADDGLVILVSHLQAACASIASLLASPSTVKAASAKQPKASSVATSGRDAPKPLDLVSNDIIKAALKSSQKVAAIASEEDDMPVWFNDTGPYVAVFDPLDGSRNIDASIPTGSIFGIYRRLEEADALPEAEKAELNVLQRGERLVAAVYALYSSATVLCISLGSGTHAFTLNRSTGDFVLTNSNLSIPKRGQIYSVNDARYFDWPEGLRRTILYGGIAMNPRAHLRLVYEANPLSFIAEQAGGKGCDGKRRILDIQPVELHQRLPLFLGSPDDITELLSYDNVQQLVNPGYEV
ncbi:hypothetical protein GOP47_0021640 [Adiantum capillus-veneris]|uniref:fructose-bisphosphatase n=1 Tax=Adiantum capillus-veneris TaxID=13818 RepID=A0A9D4U8S6_ADICA|nr:hypothetical protein GOP47_0021640 [Adiantum capillus-veneris]